MRFFIPLLGLLTLVFISCLPPAPDYPYKSPAQIKAEGKVWSDKLAAYIERWLDGQVPAQIPDSLIPPGITECKNFYLKRPEEVTPNEAWATRIAREVNFDSIRIGIPDPNVTYLLFGPSLAPFGHTMIVEGEYPHARFFSAQISPSLDGVVYMPQRIYGAAEVSIADADIPPLPGNVNPYLPGANRNAPNRKYRMTFPLAIGDPVALNGNAFKPLYRGAGNGRVGGLITYQGAWGFVDIAGNDIPGGGEWNVGNFWIRIYGPDRNKGVFGGVPLPKVWFQTPSGEAYFLGADFSGVLDKANRSVPARISNTATGPQQHAGTGWYKSFGILRSILGGVCRLYEWNSPDSIRRVQAIDLGVTGRGEGQAPPGNYEPHATTNNYANYLGRGLSIQKGQVAVLVGKMPTFPRTRNGEATMTTAECRYWSICGYDYDAFSPAVTGCVNDVMDDEVLLDNDRNYLIVYSRADDRPANATPGNKVTWVNWGPTADLGLTLRWVTVGPEWECPQAPHEINLDWATCDYAGSRYDSTLIGLNNHKGFMGCFLPRVVLLQKAEFEALGSDLSAAHFPAAIDSFDRPSANEASFKPATASSVSGNTNPSNAFDHNVTTNWTSAFGAGPHWLIADLGTTTKINAVKINWETLGAGTQYQLHYSNDGFNWTTFFTETVGDGGMDLIKNRDVNARYIRLWVQSTQLGYCDLRELEVFSNQMPCLLTSSTDSPVSEAIKARAFPNPCNTVVYIDCTYANPQGIVKVFDAKGQLIHLIKGIMPKMAIDTRRYAPGAYFACIEQPGGQKAVANFMVQRE
jgi:F5/8 type C domain